MDNISQNPNPNPQPQPKNIRSYFLIAAIILVGATAYGSIWWWGNKSAKVIAPQFTPRPDPTADWQTYRNEEYGYSIRYPSYLEQYQEPELHRESDPLPRYISISFSGIGSPANILISVYEKYNPDEDVFIRPEYYQYSKQKVNDLEVYQKKEFGTSDDLFITTLFYGKKYNYLVEFSDVHASQKVDLFNQILSTLKFTEPTYCIQVITPARNLRTGEVRDFPTPCDVPEMWEIIPY